MHLFPVIEAERDVRIKTSEHTINYRLDAWKIVQSTRLVQTEQTLRDLHHINANPRNNLERNMSHHVKKRKSRGTEAQSCGPRAFKAAMNLCGSTCSGTPFSSTGSQILCVPWKRGHPRDIPIFSAEAPPGSIQLLFQLHSAPHATSSDGLHLEASSY